jgi:hypothetical protein
LEKWKRVVLKARPMISLQSSLVSPALLEELIDEISTLASVFHKPAETFIGRGRLGADEVQRKANELSFFCFLFSTDILSYRRSSAFGHTAK